jgi:hypothetical protein
MNLSWKLWNLVMDRILEKAANHKFDRRTGRCVHCNALCLDVMVEWKSGREPKCPHAPIIVGSKEQV